jgi:hypothetical protein
MKFYSLPKELIIIRIKNSGMKWVRHTLVRGRWEMHRKILAGNLKGRRNRQQMAEYYYN